MVDAQTFEMETRLGQLNDAITYEHQTMTFNRDGKPLGGDEEPTIDEFLDGIAINGGRYHLVIFNDALMVIGKIPHFMQEE